MSCALNCEASWITVLNRWQKCRNINTAYWWTCTSQGHQECIRYLASSSIGDVKRHLRETKECQDPNIRLIQYVNDLTLKSHEEANFSDKGQRYTKTLVIYRVYFLIISRKKLQIISVLRRTKDIIFFINDIDHILYDKWDHV